MKTLTCAALSAIVALAVSAATTQAQNPAGANAAKYGIAVVDVSFIFKNHAQFRAEMDGMKGEMQGIEQQLEGKRQQIVSKEEEMKGFKPGSAERSQAEDDLAAMKAKFQLDMQKLRKGFLEKEAKTYYTTYQQVSQAIAYYAKQQNIGVVLRFNGDPADPAQRESILRDINKPVQFQNQIDITPDVLALLNRGAAPAPRSGSPATIGTRPGVNGRR